MAGEEEKERMKQLLMEAVCTLCRSGMKFDMAMRVEGLLAITVDEKDVVVVNINKSFKLPGKKLAEVSPEDKEQQERTSENEQHHRKKRKSRDRTEGRKRSASESSAEENDGKVVKIEEAESDNDNQSQMPWMLGDASANPASGQESNIDIMQADKPHSQGTSTHNSQSQSSQVQGQIKIEIDSDSDDDISVLESWDSVVQGQRDLVPMQAGSATVPVSMFSLSDGSQQLPGCSQDLAQLSANASQFPQPFTSMDSQQQGSDGGEENYIYQIGPTGEKSFFCKVCEKPYRNKRNVERHLTTVHQIGISTWFMCDFCSYSSPRPDSLRAHKRTKHAGLVDMKETSDSSQS